MSPRPEHPDRKTLQEFISGRIDDDELQEQIETHIDLCDDCAELIGQLSTDEQFFGIGMPQADDDEVFGTDLHPNQSLVGKWLGKYKVQATIGQGGMGTVYRAEDTVLSRQVAIKTLLMGESDESSIQARLIDEAQAAGSIAHPNVATVYDFVSVYRIDCLVMEYLAGGSVADLIKHASALGWEEALRLIREACQGIDAAHRRGILHRDIKPANLLLTRDRRVKVGDFGLALQSSRLVTSPTGTVAGTAHFMSPEQCRDEPLDPRSDVYSIGATLFTLLAGHPPYREYESVAQISHAHCHAPIPNPQRIDAEIPAACASIAMRAMAKKRDDRFASCGELLDALSSLSQSASNSKTNRRKWRSFAKLPTGPTVIVVPPDTISGSPEDEMLANGIACEISSQLSQFRNLRVVSPRLATQHSAQDLKDAELKRELTADYVVGGTIQRLGSQIRLTASLVSTETSASLWSQRFDRTLTEENLFDVQDEIAETVSSKLAQPYGEFHRAEQDKVDGDNDAVGAYQSVLEFYNYWHRELLEDYWPVRNSLERAIEQYPNYAPAHAALALMLVNAIRVHHLPDQENAFENAADLAERALRLDPRSEMAHQALVTSLFHQGRMRQFDVAAEKALQVFPHHCDLLADIGLFFVVTGKREIGLPLSEKAIALSPDPPGWYFSALVCNAFLVGDFALALEHARRVGEDHLWGRILLAVALAHLGLLDQASQQLEIAKSMFPDIDSQFESMLSLFHPTDELSQVINDGLRRAGLDQVS